MDQSPPLQDRLKRRALWAALWLAKLIRFMPDVLRLPARVHAYLERRLDLLADFVIHLVIIRVAQGFQPEARQRDGFANWRAASRHDVRVCVTHSMRATIGGGLRRALKPQGRGSKNLKARAEAILHALQNPDRLVACFLRRMRKGLSRRVSAHTRAQIASSLSHPVGALFSQIAFGEALRAAFDAAAPP